MTKEKAAHVWDRDPLDFYSEPGWVVDLLIEAERFTGRIWDPACGNGTIGRAFERRNHPILSTDISEDRPYGVGGIDFVNPDRTPPPPDLFGKHQVVAHVVTNPPFSITEQFIRRGLEVASRSVCVLVPLKYLATQDRFDLFEEIGRPARVYILSNRASMPPGKFLDPETGLFNCDDPTGKGKWKAGQAPRGGAIDFCWLVFVPRYGGPTDLRWISRGTHSKPYAGKPRKSSAEGVLKSHG